MDTKDYSTEHRKGQHLFSEERHEIEVRLKDGWSIYRIAKHLGRPYNTIKNEVARGSVKLYRGKVVRYKADIGEKTYAENRSRSRRQYKRLEVSPFLRYVETQFAKGWSLDACVGEALESGRFQHEQTVCTKTLYNYVDQGLIGIKNIDLPEKVRRNTKREKVRKNKRILGDSIELRPESVELRKEFGHWEIDTVVGGKKEEEPCVVTLVERKTRHAIWIKAVDHTASAVQEAVRRVMNYFGSKVSDVFKTVTADNGSEFAQLTELAKQGTQVYFTHPYSSWEKGTNECHNKLLRRFIPKGVRMDRYSEEDIAYMTDWANSLPRKILGYRTPELLFEQELDCIYTVEIPSTQIVA